MYSCSITLCFAQKITLCFAQKIEMTITDQTVL